MDSLTGTQTLGRNRRFEEAQESNQEGCRHGTSNVRHVLQLEGPLEGEEVTVGGLDSSENLNTLVLPVELPAQNGRHDNDEEAVGNVGDSGKPGLEAILCFTKTWLEARQVSEPPSRNLPTDHDEEKADSSNGKGQPMSLVNVANHELDLLDRATVAHTRLVGQLSESKFGNQLVDSNDEADGTDEAAQERLAEHAIQKPKSCEAGNENHCARHTSNNAADLRMQEVILLVVSRTNILFHHCSDKKRASSFRADDHLWARSQQSVDEGIEDEGVETVDRRDVGEVRGEGEGHGEVEGGHGDGGHQVTTEV